MDKILKKKQNNIDSLAPIGIKKIVAEIVKAHKLKFDTTFIISGMEGMGKSNLMLVLVHEYLLQTGQRPDIDFIALDQKQFIDAINKAPNDIGCVAFDEAGDGLLSRDAMSEYNKDMVKMFMVIRAKGLFTILVLPSFWYMDKYFRQHRIKGLMHVYARGKYAFWNKKQLKNIIIHGEQIQEIFVTKPSFCERFPIYQGELLKEYQVKKNDKINNMINDIQAKYGADKNDLDDTEAWVYAQMQNKIMPKDIALQMGCSSQKISNVLKNIQKKGYKLYKVPTGNKIPSI